MVCTFDIFFYNNLNSNCANTQVNYVKDNGYGGAMIWALDVDDFSGNFCGGGTYPLLTRLNLALTGSVPSTPSPALVLLLIIQ